VSISSAATAENPSNPKKKSAKRIFRHLAKLYNENHMPPENSEILKLTDLKEEFGWSDIIQWRDELGIKRGLIYEDDGSIIFEQWPDVPHDQIINVFSFMFSERFISPYQNQIAVDPVFEADGTTGNNPLFNQIFTFKTSGCQVDENNRTKHFAQIRVPRIPRWPPKSKCSPFWAVPGPH
jgi:hypothetical protein